MVKISININLRLKGWDEFMDMNKMRNIVILKDLPSNLVEEAFVVLKNNQRIKNFEYADNKFEKISIDGDVDEENFDDYIVKEAELIVSNYISKMENQDLNGNKSEKSLLKKYKIMKAFAIIFGIFSMFSCIYILN